MFSTKSAPKLLSNWKGKGRKIWLIFSFSEGFLLQLRLVKLTLISTLACLKGDEFSHLRIRTKTERQTLLRDALAGAGSIIHEIQANVIKLIKDPSIYLLQILFKLASAFYNWLLPTAK